jgi:hypothetical protein
MNAINEHFRLPQQQHVSYDAFKSVKDRKTPNSRDSFKRVNSIRADGVDHKVAGLSCAKYGGPSDEIAAEMVYWRDIPSDAKFVSPFKRARSETQYLTFEPGKTFHP